MSENESPGPPPGWYLQTPRAPRLRWWTGSEWTQHFLEVSADQPEAATDIATEGVIAPTTRAERKASEALLSVAAAQEPVVAHASAAPRQPAVLEPFAPPPEHPTADESVREPDEPFPDLILSRNTRTSADWTPPPISYRPSLISTSMTGPTRALPVKPGNGAAKASLALLLLSVIGAAASYWWLAEVDSWIAGLVNLASIGLLVAAFAASIVGLVVAIRRPTKKWAAIVAFVLSSLCIAGAVVLVVQLILTAGIIAT